MTIYIITADKSLAPKFQNALKNLGEVKMLVASKLSDEEIIDKAADAEVIVASPSGLVEISDELLKGLKHLKYITTVSVGTDFVDLSAAKKAGVVVSNLQGVNAEAVAEHLWGMILDLTKRITEADRGIREKGEYSFAPYMGKEVYGKTIGIVGLGNI